MKKDRVATRLLRWHFVLFVLLNAFVVAINLVFSPSVLWFLWVTGTWGMALALHAFAAYDSRPRELEEEGVEPANPAPVWPMTPTSSSSPVASSPEPRAARAPSDADTHALTDLGSAPTRMSERAPALQGFQVGQRVADRFVIERKLGAGGMGEVSLAYDTVLGERVALKTVSSELLSPAALERFRREAQASRRITHPNVVRIHDLGQHQSQHDAQGEVWFISMEYVEGQTLRAYAHAHAPLDDAEIERIALQLCDALHAAHGAGVVHRDLKPDNILIDKQGQVRVIDFGLAKIAQNDGLTATGAVLGTPDYMAPEQVRGEPADARTDLYALGCVLYFLVTGTAPFERASALAVGVAHCHDTPALPPSRPEHSAAWDALILRALEKAPERRYQTASELRAAITAR